MEKKWRKKINMSDDKKIIISFKKSYIIYVIVFHLIIIAFFTGSLLLISRNSSVSQNQPQKKSLSADELFEKNNKCLDYKTAIEKELEKDVLNTEKAFGFDRLDELFYSPVTNSCMYAYRFEFHYSGDPITYTFFIKNYNSDNLYYSDDQRRPANNGEEVTIMPYSDKYQKYIDEINSLKENK